MTAHEFARELLNGPDLPLVSGLTRTGYGEPVVGIEVFSVPAFNENTNDFNGPTEEVIDLILSECSSHSTT